MDLGARRRRADPTNPAARCSRIPPICALLLALALPLAALDPELAITQYIYDEWGVDEGLRASSPTAIVQTREGYLWLGTQEGLIRFDGARFTVFDRDTTPELSDQYVQSLLQDRHGRLWVGTDSGGLCSYSDGKFVRYSKRDGLPNDRVLAFHEDRSGRLWVGTDRGVAWLDGTRFRTDPALKTLEDQRIRRIMQDRSGAIWFATRDSGVHRLDQGRLTTLSEQEGLASDDVWALLEDKRGAVWIGTREGLNRIVGGRIETLKLRDGLNSEAVRALLEDDHGTVWIGTRGGGLHRIRGGTIEAFAKTDDRSRESISSILEDREGSLWLGTEGSGLRRLRAGKLMSITKREGLPADNAGPLAEDRDGNLWIGTDGGGLSRLRNGKLTTISTGEGLASDSIRSLLVDRDGGLWIGTRAGLNRLHAGRITTITERDGLTKDVIWSLAQAPNGDVWIGTDGGGLNRLRGGKLDAFTTRDGLSNNVVRALLVDREGVLWIGTEGGLNRMENGAFTAITVDGGLSSNQVRALYEDGEGNLWIGTRGGGLNLMRGGRLRTITSRDGLFDDIVYHVLEDDRGNLWMSCNRGIFRVAKRELLELADGTRSKVSSIAYDASDGMASANCWGGFQPAGLKSRDGRLWFPTTRGVAVVAPDRLKINASIPPVVIEEIVVNEHAVDRSAIGRLDAGIEKLEIHYTALSLFTPERVKFKYMLEGYDRGWVDPGARRTAYYTKVPPGDYTFRVIACNGDGVWNETGASIALSIAPRFHETRWFYLLCTIAVGSILAAGYKARTRSLKARARELESLVEERTQKLREALDQADRERLRAEDANQAKGRFLAHMSHELRTPLNAILGFVQLMQRTPARTEDDRESLSIITRSGQHLLALINDVLSMAKIESGQQSRNDAPFDLHRLVADLESLFQVRAEESGVALEMRLAPDVPRHVTGDAGKLRQVLVNLLGNAFKFTARGTVALEIEIAGPSVRFSVSDTGPGLTAEEIARLAQPFTQTATGSRAAEGTGLGLWISRRFVTLMGGELRIESTPPAGTRFSFELELPQVETADEPAPAGRVIALANMLRAPRILVAEDRAESRLFLVRLLRAVGFSVVEASNGHEAIESWRASRPDLILMDVQMPVLGGDDAIAAIRAEEASEGRPPVRIVALTAGAFEHQRESLLALGCDGFVAKPFLESTIFEAIARQLGVAYQYEVPARLRRGQGAELDLSTLARTDPAWLESVRSSLASGDVEGASRLLDRVEVQHPSMVAAMRTMIRAYRLDDLERAIAAARGEGAEP